MTGEALLEVVLHGARECMAGRISLEEFQQGVAWCTLVSQGIPFPSIAQVEERIAELNTAASFISAGNGE